MWRLLMVLSLMCAPSRAVAEELELAPPLAQPVEPPFSGRLPYVRLELSMQPMYLAVLGADSGEHFGPELSLGVAFPVAKSWDVVARARGQLAFDIRTPTGELDDTNCDSGLPLSFCGPDSDYRQAVGADLLARWHVRADSSVEHGFTFGVEIGPTFTFYANAYEHLSATRALGSLGSVRLSYEHNMRWRLGFSLTGRVDLGLERSAVWLSAGGGLHWSLSF